MQTTTAITPPQEITPQALSERIHNFLDNDLSGFKDRMHHAVMVIVEKSPELSKYDQQTIQSLNEVYLFADILHDFKLQHEA